MVVLGSLMVVLWLVVLLVVGKMPKAVPAGMILLALVQVGRGLHIGSTLMWLGGVLLALCLFVYAMISMKSRRRN